ncbi:MAG: hypothetical protein ACK4OF_05465 [Aquificaceae bacterium]
MILHPLFSYPALLIALLTFGLYVLAILKLKGIIRYALYLNGLLIFFLILSVISGFRVSNVPLVQSKSPFIWAFPHKWNGLLLLVLSVISFMVFWFKGEGFGKKLVILPFLGMLLTLLQLITGWLLRLVFFS